MHVRWNGYVHMIPLSRRGRKAISFSKIYWNTSRINNVSRRLNRIDHTRTMSFVGPLFVAALSVKGSKRIIYTFGQTLFVWFCAVNYKDGYRANPGEQYSVLMRTEYKWQSKPYLSDRFKTGLYYKKRLLAPLEWIAEWHLNIGLSSLLRKKILEIVNKICTPPMQKGKFVFWRRMSYSNVLNMVQKWGLGACPTVLLNITLKILTNWKKGKGTQLS